MVKEIARTLRQQSVSGRLLRGGIGSALIQVINRVLMLGLAIVLARTLGATHYGIYAYAMAVMAVLLVFAEAGMPTLLTREVASALANQDWSLLRGSLIRGHQFVVLASAVVATLGLAGVLLFNSTMAAPQRATVLWMLALLPLVAFLKTMVAAMRGLHHVVPGQALQMIGRPGLVLAGVAVVFVLWPGLRQPQNAMAVQVVAALLVIVLAALTLRKFTPAAAVNIRPRYDTGHWFRRAIPFTLIGGTVIINNQADIIILGWFRGSSEVGVYRVAMQGGLLTTFVLQGASAVAGPQFSRLNAQQDPGAMAELLRRTARIVLIATAPVALIFILWGGDIAGQVFGAEFRECRYALAILAAGYFANVAFGPVGQMLQMTGHEKATARALALTASLNIVLNLILIPRYGMVGAAGTTALSVFLYHLILRRIIYREFGF